MRLRNSRVRTKVAALLMSLAALWAFAAWVTIREGVNLLWATTIDSGVAQPSETLLVELQRERLLTIAMLGKAGSKADRTLEGQRIRTDVTHRDFQDSASSGGVQTAASEVLSRRIGESFKHLGTLAGVRKEIDGGQLDRVRATSAYNDVIDSLYRIYESVAALDDKEIAKDGRTLAALSKARELLARQDAMLAGVFAAGRFTPDEHVEYVQSLGIQRFALDQAAAELPEADRVFYNQWLGSQAVSRLRDMERELALQSPAAAPVVNGQQWRAVMDPALTGLQKVVLDGGDRLVERATPVAVGVVVRLALAGGLGLLAVIASIILSITTARALIRQLEKLRVAAHELSDERLPSVVARLGRGEEVDVATEAPPLEFGDDEIGQVGQAFNAVQETAIRVAVEQAELRRSIRDILLSLARRTQGLVHRQLTVLDVMERREADPEELRDLFKVDHLATRMRRNAENLIVLSGSSPGRTWRRSVPMVDVVRGALAEVEDYTRVTLMPMGQVELAGRAVGDVIHLLAELIENAVSFSPPYTMVQVSGQLVANGYVIEIEDRGLGMTPEDLVAANERIAEPPEFRLTGTARLGLYVVSRLAERHRVQVSLKASPYGGTTVVVLLPHELVRPEPELPPARPEQGPAILPRRATQIPQQGTATAVRTPSHGVGQGAGEERQDVWSLAKQPPAAPARPPEPAQPSMFTPAQFAPAPFTPAPFTPAQPETAAPDAFTPSGLPFRVPQTNLAPALRAEEPATAVEADEDERSPEEIRAMMGSFQSGTRLGRSQAAKLMSDDPGEGR